MNMVVEDHENALASTIGEEFARYFEHLAKRVETAARSLPRETLWTKPYPYGNSVGHLVLHLTGNLNHYIGAGIAGTGYVRDRTREFSESPPPSAEDALAKFREAIAMVVRMAREMDAEGWHVAIADQPPITTRFGMMLVCASHLSNHIGQMSYLVRALGHDTGEPPIW